MLTAWILTAAWQLPLIDPEPAATPAGEPVPAVAQLWLAARFALAQQQRLARPQHPQLAQLCAGVEALEVQLGTLRGRQARQVRAWLAQRVAQQRAAAQAEYDALCTCTTEAHPQRWLAQQRVQAWDDVARHLPSSGHDAR